MKENTKTPRLITLLVAMGAQMALRMRCMLVHPFLSSKISAVRTMPGEQADSMQAPILLSIGP